ncbi:MAG: HAMP domain-containing histidine kinase [Alphaproteobacteria bacterium]|nr:HAMP domain-containing histidine kinase [Alphaproteobacteria bacterium]
MRSLRQKIIVGYYFIGTLLVGLSMLALFELRDIERQIMVGARVSEFFDMVMEMRRFEKNHLLYAQTDDYSEAVGYLNRTRAVLRDHRPDFVAIAGAEQISTLEIEIDAYRKAIGFLAPLPVGDLARKDRDEARAEVRRHGKTIVTIAERITRDERAGIKGALTTHRLNLIGFILTLLALLIAAGQILSRIVTKPLLDMERSMEAVARGRLDKINLHSSDREIVSLSRAFNRMLQEIELRQRHLHFNDKLAALGTLISGVAHELNNPLSNISTSCQILLEEVETTDVDFRRQLLEQIDQQSERARAIVRSLLDFSRQQQFNRVPLVLRSLVEETLLFLKGEMSGSVRVVVSIPDDIVVVADKQRLQQVFLNLIKNALEATTEGDVTLLASRRSQDEALNLAETIGNLDHAAQCITAETMIIIEVRDSGSGISQEDLPNVFDPFFTTKDVGRGTGLGLFVVYEIVKEHGGCVSVDSIPGKGSSFFVMLPDVGDGSTAGSGTGESDERSTEMAVAEIGDP